MNRTLLTAAALPESPGRLYDMYLDAQAHAAFTGAPVKIEPRPGGAFSAFDGILTGTILHLQPKTMIVQSWRSANWPREAIDSVLVLTFVAAGGGTRIELAHVNVPEVDYADVCRGWEKYYWARWREYLEKRKA